MSTTSTTSSSSSSAALPTVTSTVSVNSHTTFVTVFGVTIAILLVFGLLPMWWYLRKRRKALQELKDTMQDLDEEMPIMPSPDIFQTTPAITLSKPRRPPSVALSLLNYMNHLSSQHKIPSRRSTFTNSTVLPTSAYFPPEYLNKPLPNPRV
ncbi:hypothetical protein M422DRAFT_26293 [Sphaerobolus stellatus SS14]|nr:hypothetical protein M422DRAFT_26293 [Sphaerobolus stellatus SS14]